MYVKDVIQDYFSQKPFTSTYKDEDTVSVFMSYHHCILTHQPMRKCEVIIGVRGLR